MISADPEAPPEQERTPVASDIRATRTTILARPSLRTLARRLASIAALLTIDVCGLALGLYLALALRWLYYEHALPLWGVPWDAESQWLPFLTLITILVFWQAGLYAERERRAGIGRVVSSLIVVVLLVFAFGLGTGHDFYTFGLIPTALVIAIVIDGLLRASYDTISRELLHVIGVRRRAIVVGEGEHLDHLLRTLGSVRGGIEYDFVGVVSGDAAHAGDLPRLGPVDDLRAVLEQHPTDELIVTDSDYTDRQMLQIVDHAHRSAVKVRVAPKTTELLVQRAEYVPGQGLPLFELRPPAFAGTDWAVKRTFDLLVSCLVIVVGLPLWL